FSVVNDGSQYPAYATVTPGGQLSFTWAASTSDVRGLQKSSGGRIGATWYSFTSFNIDVNLTDGNTHQVAIYCVDWDNRGRAERIDVLDAQTGAVLDTHTISSFATTPEYLVWNLKGHVIIRATLTGGANAVISGIFFGAGGSGGGPGGGTTSTAQFIKVD